MDPDCKKEASNWESSTSYMCDSSSKSSMVDNSFNFRIGRLGKLEVHPVTEEGVKLETKTSPIGYSVMSLDQSAELYVAGIPADVSIPSGVTRSNFTGCVGDLYIDGTLIGLANFQTNTREACGACLEVYVVFVWTF